MGRPKRAKTASKAEADDTPRKFRQLMELKQRMAQPKQAGADAGRKAGDGSRSGRSAGGDARSRGSSKAEPQSEAAPQLQRKRGESMAEFGRRVDAAIPLPRAKGVESRKTLRNSKKHKAKAENLRSEYHQRWEAKKRQAEDKDADNLDVESDGEDIWAQVNAKAKRPKFGEVADRPPELPNVKTKGSVPKSAGSLARRQMLEEERERFIERYRKLRGTEVQAPEED